MDVYPTYVAAAVQASPVFMDREATVAKACRLIDEAASNHARLIVFPEVFVPAYPYWNWIKTPWQGSKFFVELYKQSVDVPGKVTRALGDAAERARAWVVIGVNERDPKSLGTIYNTNLVFDPDGRLVGRHRKLVPTWAEKLTWSGGDGSSLVTYPADIGALGTLICGENTNTLARFALLAEGELVHAANFPGHLPEQDGYDPTAAIKLRVGAHALEGKIFCVVSSSVVSDEIVEALIDDAEERRVILQGRRTAFSGVFGPDGCVIGNPVVDEEGIAYAQIDIERCIAPRQKHNITSHYNRFDIFNLRVNRTVRSSAMFIDSFDEAVAEVREERAECDCRAKVSERRGSET